MNTDPMNTDPMNPSETTKPLDVTGVPCLTHDTAMRLQAAELRRTIEMLNSFDEHQWTSQTDCPDWDVRRMYLHVLGACEGAASMVENARQMLRARRHQKANGGPLEAGLSAVQVHDRQTITAPALLERLRGVAPRTIRKRTSLPGLLRRAVRFKVDGPVVEKWSVGYLVDTIYLRDLWMHRIDASRAAGVNLELSADHDGVIVDDIVAEWARRHGHPMRLTLTGVAGGTYVAKPDGAVDPVDVGEFDAVEFCRMLAGRSDRPADGLLATVVPF